MKYLLLVLLMSLQTSLCYAQIYQCSDAVGKTIYKDSECGSGEDSVKVFNDEDADLPAETPIEKVPNNIIIEDDRPGKLIYSDNRKLASPYTIKVNEVRIILETEDTLVVDVIYIYEHKIPADEIKIFITPNHGYWSTNQIQASNGLNVARASIGLSQSNMKKDRVKRSFTDTINIRFEHYAPKKYIGAIWSEVVKYEKNWILK